MTDSSVTPAHVLVETQWKGMCGGDGADKADESVWDVVDITSYHVLNVRAACLCRLTCWQPIESISVIRKFRLVFPLRREGVRALQLKPKPRTTTTCMRIPGFATDWHRCHGRGETDFRNTERLCTFF